MKARRVQGGNCGWNNKKMRMKVTSKRGTKVGDGHVQYPFVWSSRADNKDGSSRLSINQQLPSEKACASCLSPKPFYFIFFINL